MVREADAKIAEICRQRGIREDFRPGLHLSWYQRGSNAEASRRAELRKLAQARIEVAARSAKHQIERESTRLQEKLMVGALESSAARNFLESMPSVEELMPPISIPELEERKEGED